MSLLLIHILKHINLVRFLKSYFHSYSLRTRDTVVTIGKPLLVSVIENSIQSLSNLIYFRVLKVKSLQHLKWGQSTVYKSHILRNLKLHYYKFSSGRDARFNCLTYVARKKKMAFCNIPFTTIGSVLQKQDTKYSCT